MLRADFWVRFLLDDGHVARDSFWDGRSLGWSLQRFWCSRVRFLGHWSLCENRWRDRCLQWPRGVHRSMRVHRRHGRLYRGQRRVWVGSSGGSRAVSHHAEEKRLKLTIFDDKKLPNSAARRSHWLDSRLPFGVHCVLASVRKSFELRISHADVRHAIVQCALVLHSFTLPKINKNKLKTIYVEIVKPSNCERTPVSSLRSADSRRDLVQNLLEALHVLSVVGELSSENDRVISVSVPIGENVQGFDVRLRALLNSLIVRETILVVRPKVSWGLSVLLRCLVPVLDGLHIDLRVSTKFRVRSVDVS